jgi:hypothetical protein
MNWGININVTMGFEVQALEVENSQSYTAVSIQGFCLLE